MAGIADIGKALQYAGREGAEALDDFPSLLEASHMGIPQQGDRRDAEIRLIWFDHRDIRRYERRV